MAYPQNDDDGAVQGDQLRSIVQRIERLEGEKAEINADISDVYKESKAHGYDTRIIKKVIAIRRRDANERAEEEAILELYMNAVGENRDEPAERREPKQRVGAASANKLPAGVEMTVTVAGTGTAFEDAITTAAKNIGAKVERTKPLVGSFTPPADETPPDSAF